MTLSTANEVRLYSEQECINGFVDAVGKSWEWYKRYLQTPEASPTRFFKQAEARCKELGIECPLKLKTLQNKAGIWRSKGEVPPAEGKGLQGGRGAKSHRDKNGNPESGFAVENSPEKISPAHERDEIDEMLDAQMDAAENMHSVTRDYIAALEKITESQQLEIENLKSEILTLKANDNSTVRLLRPGLEGEAASEEVSVCKRPEHDSYTPPPIDWNWHPGIQVGTPECDDFNEVCHRISDISDRLGKYYLKGIWGPKEWAVILGHLKGPSDIANAQRRFRPKGDSRNPRKIRGDERVTEVDFESLGEDD